jgi:hypothetical protein
VKALGLQNSRSQHHTFETIAGPIAELRKMYPEAGIRSIRTHLRDSYEIYVSKYVVML